MTKGFFLLFVSLLFSVVFYAQQNDPVVIKINGKPIYKSELEDAYKKDNSLSAKSDRKSLDEFAQSYIDFRLNVEEAKAQGLDTTASFRRDYNSYKIQLSGAYTKDTIGDALYMHNIFKRFLEDVEINHVLLPYEKESVFPADTLALYKEALALRTQLLKTGFTGNDFTDISKVTSILRSIESVNGHLGWIKPLMLSLSVENAAYTLPLKEISMPIRTDKGYHIIQVLNRRPAQGPVKVEQVVFNFPSIPATQQQIDSVGKLVRKEVANIRQSSDFQILCDEFAEAYQTGSKGCEFGVVGLDSQLPFSFITAALELKNVGDISPAVMTNYGFHIIRLTERIPVPALSVIEESFPKNKIPGDRMKVLEIQKKDRLADEFNLSINASAYNKLRALANVVSPLDSTFISKVDNGEDILLTIDGKKSYSVNDFLDYIATRIELIRPEQEDVRIVQELGNVKYSLSTDNLTDLLDMFAHRRLSSYANLTLEERHPEFRKEMNNFADGILLFAVKNNNVWQKAENDEEGLKAYFNQNKANYKLVEPKYKGLIVYSRDKATLQKAEALSAKKTDRDQLIQQLRAKLNTDSVVVQFEPGLWSKGDNPFVDNKIFGGAEPTPRKEFPYFFVTGRFIDVPEDFTDVKNTIEIDYQQHLEREWMEYLHNKYKVEIDRSVLNTIK